MSVHERSDQPGKFTVRWREDSRHRARTFDTEAEAVTFDRQVQLHLRRERHARLEALLREHGASDVPALAEKIARLYLPGRMRRYGA